MHLVINGRFITQPVTGVQCYARHLMAALDHQLASLPHWSAEILAPKLSSPPPSYHNIAVRQVGYLSGHAWEQLELPLHARGDVLFCPANTAPLATLHSRMPVVVTVHDLSYRYFPDAYTRAFRGVYSVLMPSIMRHAAEVITVSQAERLQILRYYPRAAERIGVVPNGSAGVPSGPIDARLEDLRPYVLYVGSFSKRKNFPAVLKTALRLLDRYGDLRVLFVGGSPTVFNKVELPVSHDRMIFEGQVDDPERLHSYYRSAEALLFPSLYESSGLPPVEAMANGCPAIVSDIPALVERCGDAALYCDPQRPDDIFRATCAVLDDRDLRDALIRKGREHCLAFSWATCAGATLARIVDRAPAAARARPLHAGAWHPGSARAGATTPVANGGHDPIGRTAWPAHVTAPLNAVTSSKEG